MILLLVCQAKLKFRKFITNWQDTVGCSEYSCILLPKACTAISRIRSGPIFENAKASNHDGPWNLLPQRVQSLRMGCVQAPT